MPKTLLILNDPPCGTERSYNALRLAASSSRREGDKRKYDPMNMFRLNQNIRP